MTTPTLAPMLAVTEYARRVREHLADLTADDVTELTDGMEADLVEALLELPGAEDDALATLEQVEARFGPPAAYAAELRAAAGLPGSAASARPRRFAARLRAREQRASRDLRARVEAQPWWPGFTDLATTMRPAWWVLRAYALAMLGQPWGEGAFPASTARWVVLVCFLVLSVQWGRGRLGGSRWAARAGLAASVVAVVALPFVLNAVSAPRYVTVESWVDPGLADPEPGVFMDGEQVRSFHAFDTEGNPIDEFLLFDDLGRPVVTVPLPNDEFYVGGSEELWHAVPPLDVYGKAVWNSYPLQLGRWNWLVWDDATERWVPARELDLFEPPRPFERAIPLESESSADEDDVAGRGADDVTEPDAVTEPGDVTEPDAKESGDTSTSDVAKPSDAATSSDEP